jgi:hypothetical protein
MNYLLIINYFNKIEIIKTGGSSSNPCSDIYAGPSANSELEIKAVQNALNAKLGNWDAYLTLHT